MNLQNQLKKPVANQEASFYINSKELDKNIAYIKEHKIENLTLISNPEGYNLKDINFLKELPFIKNISMGACKQVENYDGLFHVPDLQTLVIAPDKKANVDLAGLLNLKSLGFTYTPKIKGFEKLINLKSLGVGSGNDDFFKLDIFKNYTHLNELRINTSIINNSLSFLKQNKNLESLTFSHMKRAFDLVGLLYLKGSLKKLNFNSSKKISNVHLVSEMVNLESLGFIESVQIESADLLKPLRKLQAFGTYGSSYFIDGDLRGLKHLKETISHFKVQDKKHYYYD